MIKLELPPPGDVEGQAPVRQVLILERLASKFVDWCAIWLPVVAGLLLIVSALVYMFGLALHNHHSLAWAITATVVIGVLVIATLSIFPTALLHFQVRGNKSQLDDPQGPPVLPEGFVPGNPPTVGPADQSKAPANNQQLVGDDDHPPQDGIRLQDYPQTLSRPRNKQVVQA
ncbi:hypothetical protein B0T17DRAFT_525598 [Bombardia bombarda]|uniref:Uncharacterized protein n=1 Tax=Bombardia bombarda TaxID=252184 RepID=A0AA40C915_9PEZI|nr:hypothetical protein B0T17DRAFT_525598 [Bombardia bombarda]